MSNKIGIVVTGIAIVGIVAAGAVIATNKMRIQPSQESETVLEETDQAMEEEAVTATESSPEAIVWEDYECKPEVLAWGDDVVENGIIMKVKVRSGEQVETSIVGLPVLLLSNPKVQIDDQVFSLYETTLAEIVKAYESDENYAIELTGRGDEKVLNEKTQITKNMEIVLLKYGEPSAYLSFGSERGQTLESMDDVSLWNVRASKGQEASGRNIWYQGGFRADGNHMSCQDLEEKFKEKGSQTVAYSKIKEEKPDYVTDEMTKTGMTSFLTKKKDKYSQYMHIINDSAEEIGLEKCYCSFTIDPDTEMITEVNFKIESGNGYPYQKFHVDGKDSYTSYYIEGENYRTSLTQEQLDNDVVKYGDLCKAEWGITEEPVETEETASPVDGDLLNYRGELEVKANNGDGTYVCNDGQKDYILGVADNASMYLTSFSESADENFQIMVPGSEFKKLPFGYDTVYESSQLYDFAGEFWGEAVVENGQITSFSEYFRE